MAAVFLNNGELEALYRWLFRDPDPQPEYYIHLFKNNFTPLHTSVDEDFEECDFDGYSSVLLENWTLPVTVGGIAVTSCDGASFVAGAGIAAPQNAYGYFVTLIDDVTDVLWAERFLDAPFEFAAPDDTRIVIPTVNLRTIQQV